MIINERIALVMLEGEISEGEGDPHYTKRFYNAIQSFANASLLLCEQKHYQKLQRYLQVAHKLFKEGNDTVKNGIANVYLYTLAHNLERHNNPERWIESFMPAELRLEYTRQHNASAP
ncbi:DUF7674 family protein [Ohtaekwangia sp.]|uniref:DUF7674 family protein n=1 Tax=Ohtaekwangia sp. TaxID=2066019 RepID=UPI002F932CCD